jgi:hypothetical protein
VLELPDSPTDSLKLADWLELYALISPDSNSSQGDLESTLRRAGLFDPDDDNAIERKALEVFHELEQRVKAAGEAYPFALAFPVLQLKAEWEGFPAYTFCLCLSYFGWTHRNNDLINPRKLFEQLSCLAAQKFLQGNVVGFGAPRSELPSAFPAAVTAMCQRIGEGGGYREQPSLGRQDDTLDLVAWKDFTDKWPSKVLMFGQCASGWNWEDKLAELQPETFCSQWMQQVPVSPLVRSFFIPHRIEWPRWEFITRKAGILFDRCRIAFWAHGASTDYGSHLAWVRDSLAQIMT